MKRIAIYAGTFDPVTLGHADIAARAAALFDQVIVAVARSTPKRTMFSVDVRLRMVKAAVAGLGNVTVEKFDGLLADLATKRGASALVRGLRGASDFDYEHGMAVANRALGGGIETVFLVPGEGCASISSSLVREILDAGGDVSALVPAPVVKLIAAAK